MTFLSRMTFGVILALGIAGLFDAVRAAEPPSPPHGAFATHSHMCGDMDARLAGRMAYAETKLGLSDAQKAEFQKLTDTMKAANEPVRKACAEQSAQPTATTLPGRLESMQKMMTARTESMAKVLPAVTKFYDSLTPEQKKIADESMMGGGHHGGGHHHGGWSHDGMMEH